MKDVADAEFFDNELEAQVKAAFDSVEPTAEVKERMLANLLAYEQQMVGAYVGANSAGAVAATDATTAVGAVDAIDTTDTAAIADTADTTDTPTTPKPRRTLRPWQVLLPAAAVFALLAIVVGLAPFLNAPFFSTAEDTEIEAASTEGATDEAEDAGTEAAEKVTAEESAELQGSLNAADSAGVEQSWARDFHTIELEDGTVLEIDSYDAPVAIDETRVGDLLEEAIALNEEATASIACSVYASKADDETYFVSFLGEHVYFSAHKAEA